MTGRADRARAGEAGPAAGNATGGQDSAPARSRSPRWLQTAAAWSWRLIAVGVAVYFGARVVSALRIVVLPCGAALLFTALLQPLAARLRRTGMPALAATWCTLLAAIAVLAGAGTLIANRVSSEYGTLVNQLAHTTRQLQHYLVTGPFHVRQRTLQQLSNTILHWLNSHRSVVAGTVVTGGRIALEIAAGVVLTLFVTFFLIKDGDRIWRWITGGLRPQARARAERAGRAAWQTLVYYIRGTVLVAAIHAAVIGVALLIIGVPLVGPLVVLVFVASFVPLIGILIAGVVAILVTIATKGLIAAVVLLVIFVVENQVESHLLQPVVLGRIVRLHPLAIILVLAVGEVVGGIAGAIVAVPTAAALYRALPLLRDTADSEPAGGEAAGGEPAGGEPAGGGDGAQDEASAGDADGPGRGPPSR
jgi:predicted PurR-regulated permease PerM